MLELFRWSREVALKHGCVKDGGISIAYLTYLLSSSALTPFLNLILLTTGLPIELLLLANPQGDPDLPLALSTLLDLELWWERFFGHGPQEWWQGLVDGEELVGVLDLGEGSILKEWVELKFIFDQKIHYPFLLDTSRLCGLDTFKMYRIFIHGMLI